MFLHGSKSGVGVAIGNISNLDLSHVCMGVALVVAWIAYACSIAGPMETLAILIEKADSIVT